MKKETHVVAGDGAKPQTVSRSSVGHESGINVGKCPSVNESHLPGATLLCRGPKNHHLCGVEDTSAMVTRIGGSRKRVIRRE